MSDLKTLRAQQSLEAARRAAKIDQEKKRAQEVAPYKRCASCGADIHHEPKEGEGLPCGH